MSKFSLGLNEVKVTTFQLDCTLSTLEILIYIHVDEAGEDIVTDNDRRNFFLCPTFQTVFSILFLLATK